MSKNNFLKNNNEDLCEQSETTTVVTRESIGDDTQNFRFSDATSDDETEELILLISQAMNEWRRRQGLNNMPNKLVLKQIINILNATYENLK